MSLRIDWESEIRAYREATKRGLNGLDRLHILAGVKAAPSAPSKTFKSSVLDAPMDDVKREDSDNEVSSDEDEDAEDDSEWVVYESKTGSKLYLNKRQMQVYHTPPGAANSLAARIPPMSVLGPHAFGEAGELPDIASNFNRSLRRNSAILSSAWQDGGDSKRPGNHLGALPEDDLDIEVSVSSGGTQAMSVDRVIYALGQIERIVDRILINAQNLSQTVCDDLNGIRSRVSNVQECLEQDVNAVDDRDEVTALVEMDRMPWDFANTQVSKYRCSAMTLDHGSFRYEKWHVPEYLSCQPLPPHENLTCEVLFPKYLNAAERTRVVLKEEDTATTIVQKALSRCKGVRQQDAALYVMKAEGMTEFLTGDRSLLEYAHVRHCLRERQPIRMALVKRPAPSTHPLDALPHAETYAKMVRESKVAPQLSMEGFRDETARNIDWRDVENIPMSEVKLPFRVVIGGVDGVNVEACPRLSSVSSNAEFFVRTFLFHGDAKIAGSEKESHRVPYSFAPTWHVQHGSFSDPLTCQLANIPRESRIAVQMFAVDGKDVQLICWSVIQLVDCDGYLVQGEKQVRMWPIAAKSKGKHKKRDLPSEFIFRTTNRQNLSAKNAPTLNLKFDEFQTPVVAPLFRRFRQPNPKTIGDEVPLSMLSRTEKQAWDKLLRRDPLHQLTDDDRKMLWRCRHALLKYPHMLPKFLLSVNYSSQDCVFEARRLLREWARYEPSKLHNVLELLDAKYADYAVRQYAVEQLREMPDSDLSMFMLQLVQALKFEPYHCSPLSQFLMERALKSPFEIGHNLFWYLKAELHEPKFCERFALILEEYLSHAGRYAAELRKQASAVTKLQRVAELIVQLKREEKEEGKEVQRRYTQELTKLNKDFFEPMGSFRIPYNPKLEATSLIIEKCRYMSSKMVPLWLVFRNADPNSPPIYIIFKSGDDLRQDILTLQLLRVMDRMWLYSGIDMRMKPYHVIATGVNDHGEGVGMIEVVTNSDTTSGIQIKYGGGARGALKLDPLDRFIKDHNRDKWQYTNAVENFVHSCAGYCVATYVLGIGDRHNGNIMVTKDGHLFHIDFGHFLGNFKKKFGVNRERAAFVFTPEMAFVMGGKKYKNHDLYRKFLSLAIKGFNVLRENAAILETLFMLMASAGMPELMRESDIEYMRIKLDLETDDKAAIKRLKAEIKKSLNTTYRRFDNWIHNMRHG